LVNLRVEPLREVSWSNEFAGLLAKTRGRQYLVDQADALGFGGIDGLSAQEQFERAVAADQQWKQRSGYGREDANLDFGLAEDRPIRGQYHIANYREFTSAAERHSVDQRDGGYIQRIEQTDHAMKLLQHLPTLSGAWSWIETPAENAFPWWATTRTFASLEDCTRVSASCNSPIIGMSRMFKGGRLRVILATLS
jgi:hypothetical protein